MKKPSIITNSYFFSLFSIIKIFFLLPLVSKHVVFSFSWTHIKTVFSCSLSDVQDFSVHRSKPCSRADLKKPLHLSKVILDPWSCILVIKDPWFMDPWIPRSILMIIVFGKVTPDRPSSWWSVIIVDHHLGRNSQVITHWPSPTPVSRYKGAQNFKCLRTYVVPKDIPTQTWSACRPRLDMSIETQENFSDTRVWHVPSSSQIPRVVPRNMWQFCLLRFFCTKMSLPLTWCSLSSPLIRHNFASNLSHFVTNLMHNLGASLAYIFVLWYYVIIVI